jgi:hypothetical protein
MRSINTFNTANYVKQESNHIANFLSYLNNNNENKNKRKNISMNSINNFYDYLNQTNSKNNNLIKINYQSSTAAAESSDKNNINNKNNELYELAFANHQLAENTEFALNIPKRLKYQMDSLKNKSLKSKTNKAANEPQKQLQLETEENNVKEEKFLNEYFFENNLNLKKNANSQLMKNFNFSNNQITDDVNITTGNYNYNIKFNSNNYINLNTTEAKRMLKSKDKVSLLNTQNSVLNTKSNNNLNNLNLRKNSIGIKNLKSDFNNDKNNSDKIVISGLHAAKIRMLKGLDLKGEKKISDAFLNVKCVGLKADFLLNGNNNDAKGNKVSVNGLSKNEQPGVILTSSGSVNKIINGFRKSNTGNFPVIYKNNKK